MNLAAQPESDSRSRAMDLMGRLLRPGGAGGGDLCAEYPLAFATVGPGEVVSLEENGETRAACAILRREFAYGDGRVPLGLIGSVVTHPDHRKQGWMSRLLDRAEARLSEQGCEHALLWAEEPAVYRSRGYRSFGWEVLHIVNPVREPIDRGGPGPRDPGGPRNRPMLPTDVAAIHALYGRHPERCLRSEEETRALLGAPKMTSMVRTDGERVLAYALVGRGEDLVGVVHEWGGEPEDVWALVRSMAQKQRQRGNETPLVVISAPGAKDWHAFIEQKGCPRRDGNLGMAKPLGDRSLGGYRSEGDAFPEDPVPFAWGLDSI